MERDYSRQEVLDIIESEARERNIPRDDFMRFAYIETGGSFNEQASRGAAGAKGLFQFVPDTADAYGIRGRELDAVANTDAAARLYQDNRQTLVNRHERDGRPYLSGKSEPDGLDMYMAHQQGGAGYRSIQTAIATGHFGRDDTRANILNNVSSRDFETVTGTRYADFRNMSDRDMATTFTQYWDQKFDRVRIPEKGIEPVTEGGQTTAPVQTAPTPILPSQPAPGTTAETAQGIALTAAHDLSVKYDHVKYAMSGKYPGVDGKHPDQGYVDCSGWVATMQNATMAEINAKTGREVFDKNELFKLGTDGAAMIVDKAQARSGVMIEGKAVTRDVLKEGMIIGEDNGPTKWDAGRYKGIDHITMVVRDPKSGELVISQSRGGEGVELSSLDGYLERKQANGVKLYATDPLAEARTLLQDKRQDQVQGQTQASNPQAPRTAASDGMLKHGEKGEDIRHLQDTLNKLGYRDHEGRALKEDGGFGDRTKEALQAYQRAHGLKADGIAGPQTLEALKKSEQAPLLSDPRHPDNAMFQQALKGMEQLGPQAFKNRQEMENAAGVAVFEAKASGLKQIDHIVLSSNGTGLFAMQGAPNDPAHHRVHLDKAQAAAEPIEKSTVQVQQETQPNAQLEREQQRSMKV
ncbi:peptidoglycan-binding protein [Pseudoxanthomonas yeongjuensis]|uniref:peptidoglycan-binding protein n=1 Tax=Pseudoxanthomonas yeongjuensis TaxID=377616 RepID=UPI0013906F80|nr:peptidoglycan-binding protein [Pseudoxanthomonas yeongjuensis]KAF1716009.1 peptidoglycan-binding protein [Pseudoxanthomonas yeongjuensis]